MHRFHRFTRPEEELKELSFWRVGGWSGERGAGDEVLEVSSLQRRIEKKKGGRGGRGELEGDGIGRREVGWYKRTS